VVVFLEPGFDSSYYFYRFGHRRGLEYPPTLSLEGEEKPIELGTGEIFGGSAVSVTVPSPITFDEENHLVEGRRLA